MNLISTREGPLWSAILFLVLFDLPTVLGIVSCPHNSICECSETEHGRNTVTLELNCEGRNLSEVPDWSMFQNMPIAYIKLSKNNIRTIRNRAFEQVMFAPGLPGTWIPRLDIDRNPISVISPHAFTGMEHETLLLQLHDTRLELFPDDALRKLVNLTDLFFTHSLITDLPNKSFHGLKKLRRIDLTGNRVGFLRRHVFKGLEDSLKSLYLNKMDLTEFPSVALRQLRRLWELKLDHNSIRILHDNIFGGFETVTTQFTMFLRHNDLTYIAPKAFLKSKFKIYSLEMERNNISDVTFLEAPCMLTFASYARINLRGNPMTCDCNLFSVLKAGFYDIHGTCVKPEVFQNIPWISKEYDIMADRACTSKEVKTWILPCMTGSGPRSVLASYYSSLSICLLLWSLCAPFTPFH